MRMSLIWHQSDLKAKYLILAGELAGLEDGIPDEAEKERMLQLRREIEAIYAEALGRYKSK